ncbi:hypothetical protein BOTBODRAFT_63838 [Botryobasidium botryosum FD-172 SS1]|uniref:Uncharacterized protein n=1 Tax=Botryobasidium botryosum (strain FD-172 SS1) TaxID=930990 RepID=A0A067MRA5_BOTB1|nr:hypothetical protein BOTBODRAFT_63838 [Botryobasidium botryosum FD-172 SS1]
MDISETPSIIMAAELDGERCIDFLPNEILAIIFEYTCSLGRHDADDWKSPLHIAAVSKRWRAIALNTPRCWTSITSIRTAEIYLPRTKQQPLEIKRGLRTEESFPHFLLLVAPYSDQWQSVDFDLEIELNPSWARGLTSCRATKLKSLKISYWSPLSPPKCDSDWFCGSTPCLEQVELHYIFIPFTSSIYSGLTRLRLSSIQFDIDICPFPARAFLLALAKCPELEELHLKNLSWDALEFTGSISPTQTLIHMPRLRVVVLDQVVQCMTRPILEYVQFSTPTQLKLSCDRAGSWGEQEVELHDFYPRIPNLDLIRRFQIRMRRWCNLNGWGPNGNELLKIEYPGMSGWEVVDEGVSARLFKNLLQYYPTPSVTELCLDLWEYPGAADTAQAMSFINSLPLLTDITLVNAPRAFLDTLLIYTNDPVSPPLRHLRLVGDRHTAWEKLVVLVHSRVQYTRDAPGDGTGSRLQSLALVGCTDLDIVALAALRGIIEVHIHGPLNSPPEREDLIGSIPPPSRDPIERPL